MLTVMCPNCRHRFPAPGCCNSSGSAVVLPTSNMEQFMTSCHLHPSATCSGNYCTGASGDYLVPRGYLSGGGCVINAPTIIHSPTIIQGIGNHQQDNTSQNRLSNLILRSDQQPLNSQNNNINIKIYPDQERSQFSSDNDARIPSHCQIATTCRDITGGSVSITTPSIQSGGCVVANIDSGISVKAPRVHSIVRPKEDELNLQHGIFQNPHPMLYPPPSGCQELPGTRRSTSVDDTIPGNTSTINGTPLAGQGTASSLRPESSNVFDFKVADKNESTLDWTRTKNPTGEKGEELQRCSVTFSADSNRANITAGLQGAANFNLQASTTSVNGNDSGVANSHGISSGNGTVIQVNATLQLPLNIENCTVSITATANALPSSSRNVRNNFNGGGIVEADVSSGFGNVGIVNVCERDEDSPTTPVSWVLPFPWGMNGNTGNNSSDLEKLSSAQRVLQMSGWYHEGLSWQQSASILKNAPVGSWLMRDSSDKRFMYAVSVQTARGPTAVRVHYVCGRFRLDAEPRMAPLMPMFECPIKMIEHYIEYPKKIEQQKEVWVDHSGQLYSQIYLTKPFLREVRSLSHLARLAVNRSKISTKELPTPLKDYIAEYPYSV